MPERTYLPPTHAANRAQTPPSAGHTGSDESASRAAAQIELRAGLGDWSTRQHLPGCPRSCLKRLGPFLLMTSHLMFNTWEDI